MTTFTKESNYNEMKAVAKEFGINPVGKNKEVLANLINEAQAAKAKETQEISNPIEDIQTQNEENNELPKWAQEEGFNFVKGEVVQITKAFKSIGNGIKIPILEGRLMVIEKPAKTKNKIKGFLLHPKTNEPQKVLITVGYDQVQKMIAPIEITA